MSNSHFSRALSLLRQEKGVSQRVAAAELSVSQALLSHYENGIREPGLNFVLRACDYYKVTADFLLGRTLARDGADLFDTQRMRDISTGRETGVDPGSLALLGKTLVNNCTELLMDLLARTGNEDAIRAAGNYLGVAVYTMFRHLCQAGSTGGQDLFSVPSQKFALSVATIDMLSSEMEYVEALMAHAKDKGHFPDLSRAALAQQETLFQSLLQVIDITGDRINRRTGDEAPVDNAPAI